MLLNFKLLTHKALKFFNLTTLYVFISVQHRCPVTVHSEYFSEGSDSCTLNNSPASSCIEDYNVAAEVEM